jgi:hypothetical protein
MNDDRHFLYPVSRKSTYAPMIQRDDSSNIVLPSRPRYGMISIRLQLLISISPTKYLTIADGVGGGRSYMTDS